MVLENSTAVVASTVDINYLFGSLGTVLALSAVTVGVAFQTIIKWWDKWVDGQPITFDKKFIGTAIATFIGALTIAIPLLNASVEVLNANIPTYGLIIAWVITAAWGYGLNNGVNGIVTRIYNGAETRLIKSGKLDAYIQSEVNKQLQAQGVNTSTNTPSGTETQPAKTPSGIVGGEDVTQPSS